jgi:membrane-associated phospholipid phosphatase
LVTAVICLAAVAMLGIQVAGNTDAGPLDQAAFDVFGLWPEIAKPLSLSTHPAAMIATIAIVVGITLTMRRPRIATLAVAGPVVAAGLNTWVLKPIFDRTHDGYLAYPSGHTTTLVAILAVITLVVAANAAPGRRVKATVAVGSTAIVLVAVGASAIVGEQYHYLTDTLGSVFWGVAVVIIVAAIIDAATPRRAKPVGDAPSVLTPTERVTR